MPDTRSHRGPHPDDRRLFSAAVRPLLCEAVADLSWLLGRGYGGPSAVKLVGDRHQLAARQRMAVARAACSDAARSDRLSRQAPAASLDGQSLALDGYNALTTVEAALSAGVILLGRDGTYRDLASMHGSFRRVEETLPALEAIGQALAAFGVSEARWLLDRPVSNSARLRTLMLETAAAAGWRWTVELVNNPDVVLATLDLAVATADSVILDRCNRWFNLARTVVERTVPEAWVLDLSVVF